MKPWKPLAAAACLALPPAVCLAQSTGEAAAPAAAPQQDAQQTPPAEATADAPPLKQEELDQMLAPLALYPDSLLTQILMASTYPVEIVMADRWVQEHKDLKGDALAVELEKQTWDASVKSLANFPEVLASLSEKLDWTTKIGDAFLADQKAVMDTIQKLRAKAAEEGNLESSEQQVVTTEAAPAGSTTTTVIKIESADPEVVYVPTYNPTVVYGTWWYPAYPPPPPYYYPPAGAAFVGFACGVAWGYAWGSCDWGHSDVDIDIDKNVNFNTNIDRDKYKSELNAKRGGGDKSGWQHDSSHRKGAAYRDSATAGKLGGTSQAQASKAREAYRGRADAGGQQLSGDRAAGRVDAQGRAASGAGGRAGQAGQGARATPGTARPAASGGASAGAGGRGSAFSGSHGGGDARRQSSRGASSRGGGGGGARRGGGGRRG